ncbi:MAG: hypothetical protein AAB388_01400 [Patescibacteria group bacterium]
MEQIPVSEGTKRLLNTVQQELFPILNELKQLLIDIQGVRINFPLYSSRLRKYSSQYEDIAKRFFVVVQKLETPDILFKGLPENSKDIASYFQFESAVGKNISEGSAYIEIIDRTLDRKRQTIFNSWTLLFAVIAIVISIFFSTHEKDQSNTANCFEKSFIQQYIR